MTTMAAAALWWLLAFSYPLWVSLGLVGWLSEPQVGLDVAPAADGRMVITWVQPGGAVWESGARIGDTLLEIDGIEVDERTWRIAGDSGADFLVRSSAGGRLISASVGGEQVFTGLSVASYVTLSLAFALTGSFIFLRSDRSTEVLVASLLFLTAATAFAVVPALANRHVWATYVETFGIHGSVALFFVFFSLLGSAGGSQRSASGLLRWGIVAWALMLNVLYVLGVTVWPEIHHAAGQLTLILIVVGLLGGTSYLISTYLHSDTPVLKERLRIMAFGVTGAVGFFVILSVAPEAVGAPPLLPAEVTILAMVLVPLSFAYAIMRHQLMGIRRLVHRGAAYALISIAVFAIYSALIGSMHAAGGPDISQNPSVQVLLLVVLFAAIPFMSGTRRLAFAAVDRLLYRDYVDHPELTRRVSVDAAYAGHIDELARAVLGTIVDELRLTFAAFVEIVDGTPTVKASVGVVPDEFARAIGPETGRSNGKAVSLSTLPVPGNTGQAAIIEVRRQAELTWVLCLGPKVTEEPFQREDLEMAQSVASHVGTILEKMQLLEELQLKAAELRELNKQLVTTQETERARIASYLHDDPLQQITDLIWRHSDNGIPSELQDDLQHIAESLRDFSARLHPAVLEDLGLVRALEWLASEASASSGFKYVLDVDSNGWSDRLDSGIELSLYRIAQEAMTNCQRHAKARAVWLRLGRDNGQVTLTVEDDGKGFQPVKGPARVRRLGLVGMRERAEQLGGGLRVMPRQPSGTKVVASIPVSQETTTPR